MFVEELKGVCAGFSCGLTTQTDPKLQPPPELQDCELTSTLNRPKGLGFSAG